jgi:hypothetical protein
MRKGIALTPVLVLLSSSCARLPRPAAMAEADSVRQTAARQTAATLAPEAVAHAEKLRRDAEAAYQSGDVAGAQILAERAIAAYEHALVLGRIAQATETANRARVALRAAEQILAQNEGEQKRVSAQADDLELRLKVIKDAVPLVSSGPADPAREQARLSAARSLALDARLLCAAARMIAPETPMLAQAQGSAEELDKRVGNSPPRLAPIDAAMRARAQCLAALTAARRVAGALSSIGKSDQLLSEISAMGGLSPVRDERGVVVTVRNLFTATQLTEEGREQLAALGRVSQAHPDFPVQVVVHAASGKAKGTLAREEERRRGDSVAKALVEAGAESERILVEAAGSAHPVIDAHLSRAPSRSERVEIIFVDPGG